MAFFWLFIVVALLALISASALLFARNAVYAVVFLVVNFLAVAVLYLTLGAPFIAFVQIAVYAGAIMVLFLFVVMLLGGEVVPDTGSAIDWQRPVALGLSLLMAGVLAWLVFVHLRGHRLTPPPEHMGAPADVAEMLLTRYLLPFEVASVLLLVAMIAALVLVRVGKSSQE